MPRGRRSAAEQPDPDFATKCGIWHTAITVAASRRSAVSQARASDAGSAYKGVGRLPLVSDDGDSPRAASTARPRRRRRVRPDASSTRGRPLARSGVEVPPSPPFLSVRNPNVVASDASIKQGKVSTALPTAAAAQSGPPPRSAGGPSPRCRRAWPLATPSSAAAARRPSARRDAHDRRSTDDIHASQKARSQLSGRRPPMVRSAPRPAPSGAVGTKAPRT